MVQNVDFQIIRLAATRIKSQKAMRPKSRNYFLHRGQTIIDLRRTGFYIHESVMDKISIVEAISERISILKIVSLKKSDEGTQGPLSIDLNFKKI